jgi:hypothetical protein
MVKYWETGVARMPAASKTPGELCWKPVEGNNPIAGSDKM